MWKGFIFTCSMLIEPQEMRDIQREYVVRQLQFVQDSCRGETEEKYLFETEQQCRGLWLQGMLGTDWTMLDGQILVTLKSVVCAQTYTGG